MARPFSKSETLNLRITPKLKTAIQVACEREHRSMSNLVEFLVFNYCDQHNLTEAIEASLTDKEK